MGKEQAEHADDAVKPARDAADSGSWEKYVEVQGGPLASRKSMPIKTASAWNDRLGKYEEPLGSQVIGIESGGVVYVFRIHEWTIERRCEAVPPWSSVYNYTLDGS